MWAMLFEPISRERILETARRLRPYVRRTPVLEVSGADFGLADCRLALKLELTQYSGSFKVRGAFANLLMRQVPPSGVIAASGGNHGAAVAFAARRLGVPAEIFVPRISSPAKIERIRREGAVLEVGGDLYADALAASERRAAETRALVVHAYDQVETLLGTGSLAAEWEEQAPRLDAVLVSVGGGGLLGGVASWFERRVRVVGVEPELAPTLTRALDAGRPVDAEAGGIAADALAPRRVGEVMFPLARRFVERVVLVSDAEIEKSRQALWDELRIATEPGGAAAFAALLSGRYPCRAGETIGVLISGGNTTR
jgi:threonine dehydratase